MKISIFSIFCNQYQQNNQQQFFLSQYIMSSSPSSDYLQGVSITIIVLNSLSLIALCFLIVVYIVNWKSIASFPMRLVHMSITKTCLAQNMTIIILNPITVHQIQTRNKEQVSSLCIFEGILKVSFDLSSIIWTTLIIYSVYISIAVSISRSSGNDDGNQPSKVKLQKFQVYYLLVGFVLPIGLACIPIAFHGYDFDQYYCWFVTGATSMGFWLRFGYFFIPLWGFFVTNIVLAFLTYKQLKKLELSEQVLKIFTRIMLFPLILFVTGLFATADAIFVYATKSQADWLNYVGIFMLNLYGLFTAIAYGLNPIIRQKIWLCFTRKKYQSFTSDMPDFRSSQNSEQIKAQLLEMTEIKKVVNHAEKQETFEQKMQKMKKTRNKTDF